MDQIRFNNMTNSSYHISDPRIKSEGRRRGRRVRRRFLEEEINSRFWFSLNNRLGVLGQSGPFFFKISFTAQIQIYKLLPPFSRH